MNYNFSDKVKDMKPSAIREIFKSLSDPEMISFAAGNPSPLAFPVDAMKEISNEIFTTRAAESLQYSITEGYVPLRAQIRERLCEKFSIDCPDDELIITTGGQQGIDLTAKVLCNEGDTVICENPSFIGALNAFRSYNTNLVGVDLEEDGINLEQLEEKLRASSNVKLLYLIPTFQNPGGITMSLEKRKRVLELAVKYGVTILEDNPYGELRFSGEEIPTLKSLDRDNIVVYCSSFSKVLSAGMRVGYLMGPRELLQKVIVVKQVNDVHTNIFFQMLTSAFIEKHGLDNHVKYIKKLYGDKCNLMVDELGKNLPEGVTFTRPQGGLFIWATMPHGDGDEFASEVVKSKVAVVPGSTFDPVQGSTSRSFRLNYSTPSDEQIIVGCSRLGEALRKYL